MTEIDEIRRRESARHRARLREFIDLYCKGRQKNFRDMTGINQGELSALLKDKSFASSKARSLEAKVGMLHNALSEPDGSPFFADGGKPTKHTSTGNDSTNTGKKTDLFTQPKEGNGSTIRKNDTLIGPSLGKKVPILSWDQARTWDELMGTLKEKDVKNWVVCPAPHSDATFAVTNNTDTMDDGTPNGYREGEILFVDPQVEAEPGRDIMVIFPDGRMTIRRLKEDAEGRYLLSLNGKRIERWYDDMLVRGVVIFSGNFR